MTEHIAYLDCHSGISGDMLLGAFCDAGFSLNTLREYLTALPLTGYQLKLTPYQDYGLHGSRFEVIVDTTEQPTRNFTDIANMLRSSSLPTTIQDTAIAVFRTLGEAEATIHNVTLDQIHFHEVGAIDSIIDIVGTIIALNTLDITQIYASPLPLTRGHQRMAHGLMPIPAPATMEILKRVKAPWVPTPIEGELVTPTGAAILATLARFEMPAISIEQIGYGFGQKQLIWPNCLRLCVGHPYNPFKKEAPPHHHADDHHHHDEHHHH
jgi:uncharacterized protein (TIGR00299 family) protein